MDDVENFVTMGLLEYFLPYLLFSLICFILSIFLLYFLIKDIQTKNEWFRKIIINYKIARIILWFLAIVWLIGSFYYPTILYELLQVDPYQILEETNFIIQHNDL